MKKNTIRLFSILSPLIVIAFIVIGQLLASKSVHTLERGNDQAIEAFKINNRIQSIINLSFSLQNKLSTNLQPLAANGKQRLTDSLKMLGTSTYDLLNVIGKYNSSLDAAHLTAVVNDYIKLSLLILNSDTSKKNNVNALIDVLKKERYAEQTYESCVRIQKNIEDDLHTTLTKNSLQAKKRLLYNSILAITAIMCIFFLFIVIIARQKKQQQLINELKIAESIAQQSKRNKEEFLANISHELRTALNALTGFGDILSKTPLNQDQKEYMEIITSNGRNMLSIVNDVLDLSKIEAGKLSIKKEPFSLLALLKSLGRMFSTFIQNKNLTYESTVDDRIPDLLVGDAERLKQILVNLISNAIKFTSFGGITINTTLISEEKEKEIKLLFSVKDTGIGIPPDKLQIIFERYEQIENGKQNMGTGLGLTIVKNLVDRFGGSLSVKSEAGIGSEFTFTSIFEIADQYTGGKMSKVYDDVGTEFEGNVLVVEDNIPSQRLLKYFFEKNKIDITIAGNGVEAIEKIKKNNFDLILMDIQMPVMDGYRAVDVIRNQLGKTMPVIAITAYVSEDEIEKCKTAGFTDYISKPVDESNIMRLISKYASQASLQSRTQTIASKDSFAYLRELIDNDEDALSEVLNELKKQWNVDKVELIAAIREDNLKEFRRVVHRMKSTFSCFGPGHEVYDFINNIRKLYKDEPPILVYINKIDDLLQSI